ncbi:MAG: universal stress protein [Bacteroidota bacterium]|nr:universal stress protein [Bacteroidota bacterium]
MKTIIVPTDFSETAENALNYAIELGKMMDATIILLHACDIPASRGGIGSPVPPDLIEKNERVLQKLERHIKTTDPPIKFELCVQSKSIVRRIKELTHEKGAELVVLGISENGVFEKSIVGSNTSKAISKLMTPVLMVPTKAKFKSPEKIVFASDYLELKNDRPLNALLNFITFFNSNLFIVNVKGVDEKTSSKSVAAFINVRKILRKVNYSIHHTVNENVVNGINDFVKKVDAEIIAMIPRKHNFFYRLFNFSKTKKMAFYSHVPLLVLPEGIEIPVFKPKAHVTIPERIFEKEIQWFNEQAPL